MIPHLPVSELSSNNLLAAVLEVLFVIGLVIVSRPFQWTEQENTLFFFKRKYFNEFTQIK